ncbi:MAG: Mut7-C RNAse domain-containing protein [bacterium]
MKFIADCMLGRLAKWLLILGYDTVYFKDGSKPDSAIVRKALREKRIFLTRDTGIPHQKKLKMMVLREQHFDDQLMKLKKELRLSPAPRLFFSRCIGCNVRLESVPRKTALLKVPPKVRGLKTRFRRCPKCRKFYWSGTHVRNAIMQLNRIRKRPGSAGNSR